jgi:hypothetical protein
VISDARELVAELEFVWDQIKANSASSSASSPGRGELSYNGQSRQFQQPRSGTDGPMRVLSPMSENDEMERQSVERLEYTEENDEAEDDESETNAYKGSKMRSWRRTVEQALVKMTTEITALREQIATGREYQGRRQRTVGRWIAWLIWLAIRHFLVNTVVLGIVLLWMRKRKDRRLEDLVRTALKLGREYARKLLPAR